MRWALNKLDAVDRPTGDKQMISEDEAIRKYGRGD
jgi:hypothetical protein